MDYEDELFEQDDSTELIDGEFSSEEEKQRILVFRAIQTIEQKFTKDFNEGRISGNALNNVRYYCKDMRAYNLLAELNIVTKVKQHGN